MIQHAAVSRAPIARDHVRRWARLAVAIVLGSASVASTFVPSLQTGDARWLPFILVVPMIAWCAWPIHRTAIRSILAGRPTPDVLATAGIISAAVWSAHAIATEHTSSHLGPIVLATVLAVAAEAISNGAEADPVSTTSRWLTPLVLIIAVITLLAWWSADSAGSAALSVLLIAAPGALRMAEPAAHQVGIRRGKEAGILLHDPAAFETSQQITAIVLDKDGTVTTGELSVLSIDPVEPEHLRNLRWFAGALAHTSTHPVARAIAKLSGRGKVTDFVRSDGEGISGAVDRHPVRLGRPRWIGIAASGGLGVETAVEVDGRILGRITVGDTIRPAARENVERLRLLGLDPVLVSDLPEADTAHLAELSGITSAHARSTVESRTLLVKTLRADGQVVAMVGGREHNAAALDLADLAFAPVDGPIDGPATRGISLAELDVQSVHNALVLTRATFSTAVSNRRWALGGMLAPVPFAAAGLISPLYAPLFALVGMLVMGLNSCRIPRVGQSNR